MQLYLFISLLIVSSSVGFNFPVKQGLLSRVSPFDFPLDRNVRCFAKKDKAKFTAKKVDPPTKAERQSREDKFDAMTRKFMFTMTRVSKTVADGSKTVLKNIDLCFFPGAKIGVVGSNGSGKSSMLKIMAGIDKSFTGTAVPMPGASVGYLPQEPHLMGETVIDNINLGVEKSQKLLDRFNELSLKCAEPLGDDEMAQVMAELDEVQSKIEAQDLWELDRFKQRAMDALRCPSGDAKVVVFFLLPFRSFIFNIMLIRLLC